MTNEEKELLLEDLCGRLPYGVILNIDNGKYREDKILWPSLFNSDDLWDAKPYLRLMSGMTEEEQKEFVKFHCVNICPIVMTEKLTISNEAEMFYWLNVHHFDYRGLIEKGLALEAPEGMYR